MDDLFEDKLQLLQLYYPAVLHDILVELLTSCGGDVDATRCLIDGKPQPKKRPAAAAQATLAAFTEAFTELRPTLHPAKKPKVENAERKLKSRLDTRDLPRSGELKKPRNILKIIVLNTPQDVRDHLYPYASFHLNYLPETISRKVVGDFLGMKDKFKPSKFFLFGSQCELNYSTGIFARPSAAYARLVYNGLERPKPHQYPESMEDVAQFTERFLNEQIIPNSERLKWQLKEPWTTDFCVVNRYEKLLNNIDWHSDRLSHIGPHNYVASISLGATRVFRLRNTYKENAPIYQIPLPHNSLFIMRPGCQEEFKHCLSPMLRAIDVHPTTGTLRFGITARCYPAFFIENLPKCKCGVAMVLRRSHKAVATRGLYFWLCETVYQNKGCPSFYWCDFTNVEGHYVAKDDGDVSTWVAPEDTEKLNYDKRNNESVDA